MFARTTLQTLLVKTYSNFLQCFYLQTISDFESKYSEKSLQKTRGLSRTLLHCTKNEVFHKDFFSKCDQVRRNLRIWSHLLKKTLMENFFFCSVKDLWWQKSSIVDVWVGAKYNSKTNICFRKKKKTIHAW